MRILVTGNLGYVGSVVGPQLRRGGTGRYIIGYDYGLFADDNAGTGCDRQVRGDIRDISAEELDGVDAIVHLAAVSNDPIGQEFLAATEAINVAASVRLARLAQRARVSRFVFASSCSVYGAAGCELRTEQDPVRPLTAYAASKLAVENELARLACPTFKVTSLRFATACGASPAMRLDLVLNDFVACALQTGEIRLLSTGTQWRPLIDTADMGRAIEWGLQRDGDDCVCVNAGSMRWTWRIGELASAVAAILGGVKVSIEPTAAPDSRSYRVSFASFEKLAPDHQPTGDLERSVGAIVNRIRELRLGSESFRSSRYIRLNHLRNLKGRGCIDDVLRPTRVTSSAGSEDLRARWP